MTNDRIERMKRDDPEFRRYYGVKEMCENIMTSADAIDQEILADLAKGVKGRNN